MKFIGREHVCYHELVNWFTLLFFIVHGGLFFFLGEGVNYHEETWVKYIKYLLVVGFVAFNWRSITQERVLFFIFLTSFFLFIQGVRVCYTGESPEASLFLNFYIALTLVLVSPSAVRRDDYDFLIPTSFLVVVCVALLEFFCLRDRIATNDFQGVYGYYRVGSCFMSPNTCGGVMNLFSVFFLRQIRRGVSVSLQLLCLGLAGVVVVMTGSRMALMVFALCVIPCTLWMLRHVKCIVFIYGLCAIAVVAILLYIGGDGNGLPINRSDADISSDWRASQLVNWFDALKKDLLFPTSEEGFRADCGWIQLYYDFGLFGFLFVVFLFAFVLVASKCFWIRLFVVMFVAFTVTQVTTYLNPYIYVFVWICSMSARKFSIQPSARCTRRVN